MDSVEQQNDLDITKYVNLVRQRLWAILGVAFVVTVIAAFVAMSLPKKYETTATLIIEAEGQQIIGLEDMYDATGNSRSFMSTQLGILQSRDMMKKVALELNLMKDPEFNPLLAGAKKSFSLKKWILGSSETETPTESDVLEGIAGALLNSITVRNVPRSDLVTVTVEGSSPKRVASIANTLISVYIANEVQSRLGFSSQAEGVLSERLAELKTKLEASERALQDFRESKDLVDVEGVKTLVTMQIDGLTEQLVEARARKLELASAYSLLDDVDMNSIEALSSLPSILNNPSVATLRASETEAELTVSELSKRYGPKHPKMVAAISDLDAVRDSLLVQMQRIALGIQKDYDAARAKERSLLAELSKIKTEAKGINRTEFELAEYERAVNTNKRLYEAFFDRISTSSAAGDIQPPRAKLVDSAVVPKSPVSPKVPLIIAAALFLSLGAGVALVFLLDLLDSTIKNADDVDRKLGVPMLGLLPLVGKRHKDADAELMMKAFVDGENMDGFRESVRTVRTGLTLASMEKPAHIVLVTSSVPGEGKTTTSSNIAEAFGQMEKTLLIDCDMRRPSVARKFELPPNKPGLSNAVAYPETLDECINSVESLGIDVIAAGPIPPNPLELLGSKNFREILETLKGRYDRIILDSAPMHAVSDALYLSTLADGVIYIVKADSTKDKLAQSGLERLSENNARLLGVVLNQVDVERQAKYGGAYAGYYDVYGYSNSK